MVARSWAEDEAQPLFFLLCALSAVVCPWITVLLLWVCDPGRREVARAFPKCSATGNSIQYCQTAAVASKRAAEVQRLRSRWSSCTAGFVCRCSLLCALCAWQVSVVIQWRSAVARNVLYEGFDPYLLLGVSPSDTPTAYSRAWRREALKYHPDKSTHPQATQRFLLRQKAYEVGGCMHRRSVSTSVWTLGCGYARASPRFLASVRASL